MAGEPHPKDAIGCPDGRAFRHPLVDAKLVTECEDFDLHREARPKQVLQEGAHGSQKYQHSGIVPRRRGDPTAGQVQVPVMCHNPPPRRVLGLSGSPNF